MEKTALIIATVALTIFGSIVVLALILNQQKSNETLPVLSYNYNDQGKLVSIQPQSNQTGQPNNYVTLVPVGDQF